MNPSGVTPWLSEVGMVAIILALGPTSVGMLVFLLVGMPLGAHLFGVSSFIANGCALCYVFIKRTDGMSMLESVFKGSLIYWPIRLVSERLIERLF